MQEEAQETSEDYRESDIHPNNTPHYSIIHTYICEIDYDILLKYWVEACLLKVTSESKVELIGDKLWELFITLEFSCFSGIVTYEY